MKNIEHKIISALVYSQEFYEKVIPYIKEDYFEKEQYKIVFNLIKKHYDKFEYAPTKDALEITLSDLKLNNQQTIDDSKTLIESIKEPQEKVDWLVDSTEKFCRARAVYKAILTGISVYEGASTKYSLEEIPEILESAISITFDDKIGHDYTEDIEARYEKYTRSEERIEFDIHALNLVTDGGLKKKTLNLFVGSTCGGKSLTLCHCASSFLMQGKNVLYISLEMSEESIAERIDANLLDIKINHLKRLSLEHYKSRFNSVLKNTSGKLIIKEYPTGSAHAHDFKYFLNELKNKKGVDIDVLIIDYLTICASYKCNNSEGYIKNKSVAEEIRALAMALEIPVLSAAQLNRSGSSSSEPTLQDIAESYGIAQTADLAICLIGTPELEENKQIMGVQMKNRYNDPRGLKKFKMGIDKSKMKLYNLENFEVDSSYREDDEDEESNFNNLKFSYDNSINLQNTNFVFE